MKETTRCYAVNVKLNEKEREMLSQMCRDKGMTQSELLRYLLRSHSEE